MNMGTLPEIDIVTRLREIKAKGYVKTLRPGDTGIGYTLETLLGLRETNVIKEDLTFRGVPFELKAQRKRTTSMITLFTKEPIKGSFNDKRMIEKYGYRNRRGRKALKVTLTTRAFTPQGLKLEIERREGKLYITNGTERIWYWIIEDLKPKIGNLIIVFASSSGTGREERFLYDTAFYVTGLKEECFLSLLEDGTITIDLRMHLRSNGSVRNHGTAFRIKQLEELLTCYEKREQLL
jgi:hypothetical protein